MSKMLRIRSAWSASLAFLCFSTALSVVTPTQAEAPSLLRMFSRAQKIDVDASKPYLLTQEDGPWMILAHTFLGPGSKERAERLVLEIRKDLNLPAFLYEKDIDFSGQVNPGTPIQQTGGSSYQRRMRYANEIRYEAHAVLVGEYDSAEHPRIESDLERIKTARCGVFGDAKEMAAETDIRNPVTAVKALHRQLVKKMGDPKMGAMGNAFLTRNPILPEDYFKAPELDSFVRKLNEGKPYSLIDQCDGRYTVVVRTFSGFNTIVDGKRDKSFIPSGERLDRCAADASEMVALLRKEGVEAYQFHDRTQSIVTIGSFQDLGRELPNGGFEYEAPILAVMNEYRAFNVDANLAHQVKKQTTQGVPVKCVAEKYPFDVQPMPIRVPKPSKRGLYSAALGR